MERHYYRCDSCLGVWAINGQKLPEIICSCLGRWLHIGIVFENRLNQEKEKAPCDNRCTNASGPSCSCPCRSINHGTGRVVTVLVDAGGIPRAQDLGEDEELRLVIANQWRKTLEIAIKMFNLTKDYRQKNIINEAIRKARKLKTHDKRMTLLRNALGG